MQELSPLHPGAPRLVPGAALPPYRFLPGVHPHPRRDPRGHSHGTAMPAPGLPPERWREDRSYLLGIDLYDQGFLWEAHEAWEAGFFAATDPAHRLLLQALVQLGAGALQAHRRKGRGVRLLALGAAEKLRRVAAARPPGERWCGLDVARLLADVERHFAAALDPAVPEDLAWTTRGEAPRLDVR